jgi:hypothetical protein
MHSLPAEGAQFWFFAKAAVGLVPIVTIGAADVIGWFLRRSLWRRTTMAPRSEVQGTNGPGVRLYRDETRGRVADRVDSR